MEYLEYNAYDWYWLKADGTVYSSARNAEFAADDADYVVWLEAGGVPTPYPKDSSGQESWVELMKILSAYEGLGLADPDAYEQRGDDLYKIRFSKKDFLMLCDIPQIVKLNTVINSGNALAQTVHDLLFAADYIDVTDKATVDMVKLLTTEAAGSVLTAEQAAGILQGVKYESADNSGHLDNPDDPLGAA